MVVSRGHDPDFLVQSRQWLLGYFYSIEMRKRSSFLCCSRGTNYPLLTSSNDIASSEVFCPESSSIYHFLDWNFVSLSSKLVGSPIHALEGALLIAAIISSSVIVASLYRIVLINQADRTDPLCK